MNSIRVSAKAIIIQQGRLLTIQKQDQWGAYYLLPGGGQNPGENLHQAVRRECLEEVSLEVIPGDLLFVRDYIASNHEYAEEDGNMHQLELMFACQVQACALPGMGSNPDTGQTGVEWLPVGELDKYRLYPQALIPHLQHRAEDRHPVYLGDVN